MKPYRDVFGNNLTKKDVTMAVQAAVMTRRLSPISLHRATGLGIGKSNRIYQLLQDANVVGDDQTVIFKGFNNHAGAVNAALRQLKKGRSL